MNIKLLDFSDIRPDLKPPGRSELHVWILRASAIDNLHKHAHIYLKQILSLYTKIPQEKLQLGTGKYGKPFLLNNSLTLQNDTYFTASSIPIIQFNLSHSGQYAALVFSSGTPVGIDIEQLNRNANMDKIASRIFLPEEIQYLQSLTETKKRPAFFRLWTRTESFLKGIGTGFSASFTDEKIQEEYSSWNHQLVCAPDGYVCSVSYRNF